MNKKDLDHRKLQAYLHWQRCPDVPISTLAFIYGPSKNTISNYITRKLKEKKLTN